MPVVGSSPGQYLYAGPRGCYTNQSLSPLRGNHARALRPPRADWRRRHRDGRAHDPSWHGGSHQVPFHFENYGGPGPIIAGVIVLATSLYLLSIWKAKD